MFFSRTLFCSLRPQVLTEIGSVLFDRRSQRNSLPFPSTARSQRNSVPFPSSAIIRTRFCSPERPVLNGTQFRSRTAVSQRNSVLFSWAAASQRNPVLFTGGCFSTEPGSVHGRPLLNGTQFRSRVAASQRNPVLFTDGRFSTELSSVPGQLHHNGTRFCSRTAVSQRNSVLFSWAAASQRNSVLFPSGSCIPTELSSVPPGRPVLNGTQFPDIGRSINYNNFPFLACHLQRREAIPYGRPIGRFGSFCKFAIYDARKIFHFCIVYLQIYTTSIAARPRTGFVPVKQYCLLPSKGLNLHSCHCFFTVYK